MLRSLVGSEMCIRDRYQRRVREVRFSEMSPVLLLLLAMAAPVAPAGCNGQSKPGPPNLTPIYEDAPVFQSSVPNGKHFVVGDGDDKIDVLHLYGTPYDWGKAHGQLMKDKLQRFFPEVEAYMETQLIAKAANSTFLAWVAKVGVNAALDMSYEVTKQYTPAYAMEEIQGIADGSGVDVSRVRRLMWIGELTRGHCSMFGAWGNATASRGGKLLQLRALDWDVDGPFKNYPALVVYHPANQSYGHPWANFGLVGWTASITGMSSAGLAISEIGVSYPDPSFGRSFPLTPGYPFGFLLRDILQHDRTLQQATNRILTAKRTAELILGVGEAERNQFLGFEYAPDAVRIFDDRNLEPLEQWHPRISEVVYWGMDWVCPNDNSMLSHQLQALHGNITADNTIREIVPYVQTGDLHIAVYDHSAMTMYVATAAGDGESGPANAYQRQFIKLDLAAAFSEPAPAV
eukprot:TRINITY_DN24262_c0_g1_i1.p1 TRINITY_DN24262_c0_g1~~TRINITY_DN24262_c0_g1_i1.p1  ORF type:complete len:489 (+),score=146.71 TRINITY_DN24262_c0_g1_i1:90-1469(+)